MKYTNTFFRVKVISCPMCRSSSNDEAIISLWVKITAIWQSNFPSTMTIETFPPTKISVTRWHTFWLKFRAWFELQNLHAYVNKNRYEHFRHPKFWSLDQLHILCYLVTLIKMFKIISTVHPFFYFISIDDLLKKIKTP